MENKEFKTCATYNKGNREVIAVEYDGFYSVLAYVDGVLVNSYDTDDKAEAMEIFAYNADIIEMYAMAAKCKNDADIDKFCDDIANSDINNKLYYALRKAAIDAVYA